MVCMHTSTAGLALSLVIVNVVVHTIPLQFGDVLDTITAQYNTVT